MPGRELQDRRITIDRGMEAAREIRAYIPAIRTLIILSLSAPIIAGHLRTLMLMHSFRSQKFSLSQHPHPSSANQLAPDQSPS